MKARTLHMPNHTLDLVYKCLNVCKKEWMKLYNSSKVFFSQWLLFQGLIQNCPDYQSEKNFSSIFISRTSYLKSNCSNLPPQGLKRLVRTRFCQMPQHGDHLLLCSQGNDLGISFAISVFQNKLYYDHLWSASITIGYCEAEVPGLAVDMGKK